MSETDLVRVTIALVFATLLLAIATLLVWWEARRQRIEAGMVVSVAPWEVADGQYPAIHVDNAGPAIARDVSVKWDLNRKVDATNGLLREPAFGVGFRRTILPDRDGKHTIEQLAAEEASIHVEMSWKDGRRGRQHQTIEQTLQAVHQAYNKSGAMPRPSQIETLYQIRDHLKTIAKNSGPEE
jgi:hypothetical protein